MNLTALVDQTGPWNATHDVVSSVRASYVDVPDNYFEVVSDPKKIVSQKRNMVATMVGGEEKAKSEMSDLVDANGVLHLILNGIIVGGPSSRSRYYGTDEIALSLLQPIMNKANNDKAVKAVNWKISSPGGLSTESRNFVEWMKTRFKKPLFVFSSGEICSAAMDMAALGEFITAESAAQVGCVGTVFEGTAHKNDKGYGITYFYSSGELKSLSAASDAEGVITPEMDAYLKELVGAMGNQISESVIALRHITNKQNQEEIKTGKVFLAQDAKNIGLIDNIGDEQSHLARVAARMKKNPAKTKGSNIMLVDDATNQEDDLLLGDEIETPAITPPMPVSVSGLTPAQSEMFSFLTEKKIENLASLQAALSLSAIGLEATNEMKVLVTKYATAAKLEAPSLEGMSYAGLKAQATAFRAAAKNANAVVVVNDPEQPAQRVTTPVEKPSSILTEASLTVTSDEVRNYA